MATKKPANTTGEEVVDDVKQTKKKKVKVSFDASKVGVENRLDLIEQVLANMLTQTGKNAVGARASGKAGVLLHGDPGTGKTSFVRELTTLIGMDLVVIEAPHITEEHIINIPFIVFNTSGTSHHGDEKLNQDYELVLADSALFSTLNKSKAISDSTLCANIYKKGGQLLQIWEELGGTQKVVPKLIARVRASFHCVLFLDEFFRQGNRRIRNMLRGILNGQVGQHDMPEHVYVIYATNVNDEGAQVGDSNEDFQAIEVEKPSKDEWFAWLVKKYEKDGNGHLNKKVVDEFYNLLEQDHLSHNDIQEDVRLSPRRWEQILTYLSASLPVKTADEGEALVKNIRASFKNYQTGKHSELVNKVVDAVVALIEETSNIKVSTQGTADSEWRTTLEHQIQTKMKLGEHRKYIPIISGNPGIGKTSEVAQVALKLHLVYIHIDCSTLSSEDILGIPLASNGEKNNEHAVKFSKPKLWQTIQKKIVQKEQKLIQSLPDEAARKEWKSRDWKYLVFFDELNRTDTATFNALRRVVLEKSFSDEHKLPPETIVMGAINPNGSSTENLTNHMKDVIDVIDAAPSWKKTEAWLENMHIDASSDAKKVSLDVIHQVINKFKSAAREHAQQSHFYLMISDEPVYISPREISGLYENMVHNVDIKLERVQPLIASQDNEKLEKAANIIHGAIVDSNAGPFIAQLSEWIAKNINIGEGVFYKKPASVGLAGILEPYWDNFDLHLWDDAEFMNYLKGTDPQQTRSDLIEFLQDHLSSLQKVEDAIEPVTPGKNFDKDDKQIPFDQEFTKNIHVGKFEHLARNMAFALKKFNISNDVGNAVGSAFRQGAGMLSKFSGSANVKNFPKIILRVTNGISDILKGKNIPQG